MSRKSLLWSVLGGCLIVALVVVVSLVFYFFSPAPSSKKNQPEQVVDFFFQSLKDGHYDKAWSQLSKGLQGRYQNRQNFEKRAKGVKPVSWSLKDEEGKGGGVKIKGRTSFRNSGSEGLIHCETTFYLRKEKGGWKIYGLAGPRIP